MRGLRHAAGFLRHELAQRLTIRHVPELTFQLDESIARGARVIELLNQVSGEAAPAAAAPAVTEERRSRHGVNSGTVGSGRRPAGVSGIVCSK